MNLQSIADSYVNSPEWHEDMYSQLFKAVQNTPWLKEHRDWAERDMWGMGERAFHEMWRLIVETLPDNFRFLEIGVYRGSSVSLIGLIAKHMGKTPVIVGISPFEGTSDTVNYYEKDIDYLSDVETFFKEFSIPYEWFVPIRGFSQSKDVIEKASDLSPYDAIFIDGGHEYNAVRLDIENYMPMLKVGGIVVTDDSSCHLNMPYFDTTGIDYRRGYNRCWSGLQSVSDAVEDFLVTRDDFVRLFAVSHDQIFRKIE